MDNLELEEFPEAVFREDSVEEQYMKRALALARRGLGKTSPNPLVGAVIVRDERVIGEGYHHRYGGAHAEVNALRSAQEQVIDATIYVTMEPCCRYERKVPSCLETIIESGVRRVVVGTLDPHPEVNGRGIQTLYRSGIETSMGVLEEACRKVNEMYFKYIRKGIPFVTLKFAQTLDGRIATTGGSSQWISSDASLRLAHRLRGTHDAILIGIGTLLKDDPRLTVRLARGTSPIRVIADSKLRIPLDSRVLQEQDIAPTIIATTLKADETKKSSLMNMGIEVMEVAADSEQRVDLEDLLLKLGRRGISSVLVEGGSGIITSMLSRGLADKLVVAVAPKILGKGIEAVGNLGISEIGSCVNLASVKICRKGMDLILEGDISS
jgi:diaminohydroxyphosphoribosylaminopyrimidine deaminase / 5-amino-6-(5-phosphoribosylamino)uracil reductase